MYVVKTFHLETKQVHIWMVSARGVIECSRNTYALIQMKSDIDSTFKTITLPHQQRKHIHAQNGEGIFLSKVYNNTLPLLSPSTPPGNIAMKTRTP